MPGPEVVVVDVWLVQRLPAVSQDHVASLTDVLTDVERDRLTALPGRAAGRFLVGRALLRSVLARRLGTPAGSVPLVSVCPACGGPHGPITVAGRGGEPGAVAEQARQVHVSLTRAGPVVAVAVCEQVPVGIDTESIAAVRAAPLADVALSPGELEAHARTPRARRGRALARAWVRKEAALKALGTGLSSAPAMLELRRPPCGRHGVDAVAGDRVAVADLRLGRGRVGAVAVVAPHLAGRVGGDAAGTEGAQWARLLVRRHDGARLLRAGPRT